MIAVARSVATQAEDRLHRFVSGTSRNDLYATTLFLVVALAVLPLLPAGPVAGLFGVRPRMLWAIVLLLSGLNFTGYLARRAIGPTRGYALSGVLGGIASSTAVTLQFGWLSRENPEQGDALGLGIIGACTVVPIRIVLVCAALSRSLALAAAQYLVPAVMVGVVLVGAGVRRRPATVGTVAHERSPLRFWSALRMAAVIQVAISFAGAAQAMLGAPGLLVTGALIGIADADALAISMSGAVATGTALSAASQGIMAGLVAATLFRAALAAAIGSPSLRRRTLPGLVGMAATTAAIAAWSWLT